MDPPALASIALSYRHTALCLAHLSCLVTLMVGSARCLSICIFVQALPFTWSFIVRVSVPSSEVLFLCAAHFRARGPYLSSESEPRAFLSVCVSLYFVKTDIVIHSPGLTFTDITWYIKILLFCFWRFVCFKARPYCEALAGWELTL